MTAMICIQPRKENIPFAPGKLLERAQNFGQQEAACGVDR